MVKSCCPYLCSFGRSAQALRRTLHRPDLPGAACPVSSADRCSVYSVRACALVRGVVCLAFGHGLPCCLCCAVCTGALGAWVSTGGVYSRRPDPPGQSRHHRKNKKGSKKHPAPYCQFQKFRAKIKRPLQRV